MLFAYFMSYLKVKVTNVFYLCKLFFNYQQGAKCLHLSCILKLKLNSLQKA